MEAAEYPIPGSTELTAFEPGGQPFGLGSIDVLRRQNDPYLVLLPVVAVIQEVVGSNAAYGIKLQELGRYGPENLLYSIPDRPLQSSNLEIPSVLILQDDKNAGARICNLVSNRSLA